MGGAVVLDGSCQGVQLSIPRGMGRIGKYALRDTRSNDRCVQQQGAMNKQIAASAIAALLMIT